MTLSTDLTQAVIQQLERSGNTEFNTLAPGDRYRFIAQQVEKAQKQYRLEDRADILLFCTLALAGGSNFDRAPLVAHALERVLKEAISFGKAYWQDFPSMPRTVAHGADRNAPPSC